MTACTRPDCDGAIEDGYCNVCGLAPVGRSQRVAAGVSAAGSGGPSLGGGAAVGVGPCARPGCDGAVEADGYCNVCGLAPVGGPGTGRRRPRPRPRRSFPLR